MTATLQKNMVVCAAIVLSIAVASADAETLFTSEAITPNDSAILSKIHVSNYNILMHVDFEQNINASNINGCWFSDLTKPENEMVVGQASGISEFYLPTNSHIKTLPAAPGAIIMGLIGFLLVTLVRDRKFWLSVFAGIIVIGQVGVLSVPRIAARLSQHKQQMTTLSSGNFLVLKLDNVFALKAAEITNYIGLLRRLAGSPDDPSHSLHKGSRVYSSGRLIHNTVVVWSNSLTSWNTTIKSASVDSKDIFPTLSFQFYLQRQYSPSSYFPASFAFQCLPRGPPFC